MSRMIQTIRSAVAVLGAAIFLMTGAMAQDYSKLSERDIDKQLALVIGKGRQLQDLTRLQSIGNSITSRKLCGVPHARAVRTYQDLLGLNKKYRKRADRQYQQEEEQIRQANAAAVREYRLCFTDALQTASLRWPEKGVVDYPSFQRLFSSLAIQLRGESEASLQKKAEDLYVAKQRFGRVSKFPLGMLKSVNGDVQLMRNNRAVRAGNGINIHAGDQFTTGRTGRLVVEFTEVVGKTRRGPFSFSLGPNSQLNVGWQSNMVVQNRKNEAISLEVGLSYGAVRIESVGAGFDSNYLVHTSQGKTQVLGADTIISHYPKRRLVNTKLRSGVAEMSQGSGKPLRLKPNQQLSIRRGVLQSVSDLPDSQWQAALVAAGGSDNKRVGNKPRRTNPIGRVARQDIRRRARARAAVDAMLIALRGANANGLLTSTSGEAQRNARNSMRRQSLRDVLKGFGPSGHLVPRLHCLHAGWLLCRPDRSQA